MTVSPDTLARIIGVIDLTNLDPAATVRDIDLLCQKAVAQDVAAVCIHVPWIAEARQHLAGHDIHLATVLNFPHGTAADRDVLKEAHIACEAGADELDLVVPYMDGARAVERMVAAVHDAHPEVKLKTILETGNLSATDQGVLARAAIAGGADMLKTSTGMVKTGATPEAAAILLREIAAQGNAVGLKVSGGIRTAEDAASYVAQADAAFGHHVGRDLFRIGCSGLLDALIDGRTRGGY